MKHIVKLFFIAWAGVFLLSFFTASNSIPFIQRLVFSGVLALGVPILLLGKKETKKQPKGEELSHISTQDVDIHQPLDPKVLYRVRKGKIYRGMDAAPVYEIKGNKIYAPFSPQVAYRIEKGKVYRGMEVAPILEIKARKVYRPFSSKVEYEIWQPKGM